MRRSRHIFLAACSALGFLTFSVLANEPTYTKTAPLPPLRITYAELQSLLDKSAALITTSSSPSSAKDLTEKLSLEHRDSGIEIKGRQLAGSSAKLPKLATRLRYTTTLYQNYKPAPVSSISMDFRDYDRQLTVQGTSPEQVDAVFAALKSDLLELSSIGGGSAARMMVGLGIITICVFVVLLCILSWLTSKEYRLIFPIVIACIFISLLVFLPFDEFLAGFSVTAFDPSFASRYSAELTLVGFVLTLAGIPLSYFLPVRFAKQSQANPLVSTATASPSYKGKLRKRRVR